ncbi:MAG: AbrB/MazE/SpoVT family DNA-binding domain-containing protein [Terracidiphilus sp.]
MPSAMVTFNGRITLPPNVRKQLGLRTGDSVEFVEIGNGRFAIAPGPGSFSESASETRAWIPELSFDATEDEPRFMELDESYR